MSTHGLALVTGGSSGIGAAYADRLARRGCGLILVARDRPRLDQQAEHCRALGATCTVIAADLTDRADLRRIARLLREDPVITLLVNNAGIATLEPLAGGDLDLIEALVQTNVTALACLASAAAAAFAARGTGTIINLSSVLAVAPEVANGAYAGSKAFVLALSQSLAREVGPRGVRVQAVLPGMTRTDIWRRCGKDRRRGDGGGGSGRRRPGRAGRGRAGDPADAARSGGLAGAGTGAGAVAAAPVPPPCRRSLHGNVIRPALS
jgi:short-subunit dehydrogenase